MINGTLTYSEWIAVLDRAGVEYYVMPGAADRCRCHTGSHARGVGRRASFGPTYGVTNHVSYGAALTGNRAIEYCWNILVAGNGITKGPLYNCALDGNGRAILVAVGRCNHEGGISDAARRATINGTWSTSGNHNLRGSGQDGNTIDVAVSALATKMTPAQRRSMQRINVELVRELRRPGRVVHGHGEASSNRGFDDPGIDMGQMRRDVVAALTATARPTSPTKPTQEAPEMITIQDRQLIAAEVVKQIIGSGGVARQTVDTWLDALTETRGHTLVAQAAAKGVVMTGTPQVVAKIAQRQGVDNIDEDRIGKVVIEGLAPLIHDLVESAVASGGSPTAVADAVVARLGEALAA